MGFDSWDRTKYPEVWERFKKKKVKVEEKIETKHDWHIPSLDQILDRDIFKINQEVHE